VPPPEHALDALCRSFCFESSTHRFPKCSSPRPPLPPVAVWITPPFLSPRFNHFSVSAVLSFHLSAPPDILRAKRVSTAVFRVAICQGQP
jgi:hypothetical protein